MRHRNPTEEPSERKNFITHNVAPYICEHCGTEVAGGRYNNHCPKCLWSKHVDDKIPGDRASSCQQLMPPISVIQSKGKWRITQQCMGCNHAFIVNRALEDNFDVIIELSHNPR